VVSGLGLIWAGLCLGGWALTRERPLTLGPAAYFFFLAMTWAVLAMAGGGDHTRPGRGRNARSWIALAVGSLVGLILAYQVAVVPLLADAAARSGRVQLNIGRLELGVSLLRRALTLAPWRDYYADLLAGGSWEAARRSRNPEPWLQESEAALLRAIEQNPSDPSHALNLSALNAVWAELLPSTRSERLAVSRRYALVAFRLDPVRSRQDVEERLVAILVQEGKSPETARSEARRLLLDLAPHARLSLHIPGGRPAQIAVLSGLSPPDTMKEQREVLWRRGWSFVFWLSPCFCQAQA